MIRFRCPVCSNEVGGLPGSVAWCWGSFVSAIRAHRRRLMRKVATS